MPGDTSVFNRTDLGIDADLVAKKGRQHLIWGDVNDR